MKKSRINIQTNILSYIKILIGVIFGSSLIINKFRFQLQNFFKTRNLIITSQGRSACYFILRHLISNKKKKILISPFTLPEVINSIFYAGGEPVYVDMDIKTGLPKIENLKKLITSDTAAIIITHLYSNKINILKFKNFFFNKIPVIEDVAINFGAKLEKNKLLGTIFDYGFCSFGVMKNLSTLNGGLIIVKNKISFQKILNDYNTSTGKYPLSKGLKLISFCALIDICYNKLIYNFFTYYLIKFLKKKNILSFEKFIYPGLYPKRYVSTPENYFLNFFQPFSYLGLDNLKKLNNQLLYRRKNVMLYEKYLCKKILINNYQDYDENVFLEFPILLKKNSSKLLSRKLYQYGYDIRHTWYLDNSRSKVKKIKKNFINCAIAQKYILCLPTHNNIFEQDIIKISNIINNAEN
jgi:dTDP-4-amino-4,6-dideoxygalactose transaminase